MEPFANLVSDTTKNYNHMVEGQQLPDGNAGDAIIDLGYITFFPRQQQPQDITGEALSPQSNLGKMQDWSNGYL